MRSVALLAVILAVAAGAVALNVALLDRAAAQNDPVGRLAPGKRPLPAPPRWIVRSPTGPVEDGGADD